MLVTNSKRVPFVRTNGHNLWINVVAQKLLDNPIRVDIGIDTENNQITIRKNDESGAFKITYTRDKQCKISSFIFLRGPIHLKNRTRFVVHGGNGIVRFSVEQAV
ncbi:MAG: hypothetical protein LKJ59_01635 [Oscillospiraceae bacterium]|jgi:hypothetical protein|nr:hypothetical protein [Oscillospiraceae bacterium]MCI2034804.1 hypothetical protein [Oscillospiraceae bacterium]